MTIDERLEALTERHEALTQTVELIAGMQKASEDRIAEVTAAIDKLKATAEQDGINIRALARIAEMHERRLSELEGGQPS